MKSTTHKQSNARKGFLLALASTAVISTNYVTAKYALKGFDAWTFSVIWCAAAAVYTFIILLVTGRAREIIISRRSFWAMLYLGLITAAGMILTWAGTEVLLKTGIKKIRGPTRTIMIKRRTICSNVQLRSAVSTIYHLIRSGIRVIRSWV